MASLEAANLFSVKDMVFVITGGGSGIGSFMANAFDINGAAKVFILGRREEVLKQTTEQAKNHSIIPVTCDTTSKASLSAAVTTISAQTPFVNCVIANSGVLGPVTAFSPKATLSDLQSLLWSQSDKDEVSTFTANTLGAYWTALAFLPLLDAGNKHPSSPTKKAGGYVQSQFISTSSVGAFVRNDKVGFAYSASKAAILHATKMLATELAPHSIRANCIAPGLVLTPMTEAALGGNDMTVPGSLPIAEHPSTRAAGAEDIAGVALFLASRAGAFVNGNAIIPDGGALSIVPGTY